jgi:acyl-coenzyme A synthetase/AMP-(fatty) acid ligase
MTNKFGNILNITDALFSKWDNSDADKRIAIYYKDEIWTYRKLIDEINKLGNGLKELGIEKENRILMIAYDTPYFITTFYGAMKIGAVPVPINTYLKPEEYIFYLEDTNAKVLVIEPDTLRIELINSNTLLYYLIVTRIKLIFFTIKLTC